MPTRRSLAVAVAVGAALVGAVAGATAVDGPADRPDVAAVRADPPRPAVVVGDSAISAIRWVPGADNAVVGFEHTLDLESCRRLYLNSCRGREGRRPPTVYAALDEDHRDKYDRLIVATGYNDGTYYFTESFLWVVYRARELGYSQIVWLTLRAQVDYVSPEAIGNHETYTINNQVLRDLLATGQYPDVVLADWNAYTQDKHEWFVTDGVHYRAEGAWAASDYLSRKMAYLDGRSCPFPTTPGEAPQDPCPDPDVTGPIADIAALYPIGQDGVLCYEIGDDHRIECRYDTHVIQLTRELSHGMVGTDVGALQTRLGRLDFLATGADGIFGDTTADAVRSFQASVDLETSGVADRSTLEELGFDVGGVSTTAPTTTTPTTPTTPTTTADG